MSTNLAIAAIVAVLIWLIGVKAFVLVHLPIMLLAASIGVWLFYVQHQFEETTWEDGARWDRHEAALHGSSHYELPAILRWFTANIGVHHIHHLSSNIPYYRLGTVLRDHPELRGVARLTLWQSFRCVRLVLWDEGQRRLVSFRASRAVGRKDVAVSTKARSRHGYVTQTAIDPRYDAAIQSSHAARPSRKAANARTGSPRPPRGEHLSAGGRDRPRRHRRVARQRHDRCAPGRRLHVVGPPQLQPDRSAAALAAGYLSIVTLTRRWWWRTATTRGGSHTHL